MRRRAIAKKEARINLAHGLLRDYCRGCRCRPCTETTLARKRARYQRNPASDNDRNRAWRAANVDKERERKRRYASEHREELAARRRARHEASPEHRRAINRRWAANNPEKRAACSASWRARNTDYRRERYLWSSYGLSEDDRTRIIAEQGGVCPITGDPITGTRDGHVDHCHKTGKIRGILSPRANVSLGNFRDDPELFERAAAYLGAAEAAGA